MVWTLLLQCHPTHPGSRNSKQRFCPRSRLCWHSHILDHSIPEVFRLEGTLKTTLFHSCHVWNTFQQLSNLALDTTRDGTATAAVSNPCQGLSTKHSQEFLPNIPSKPTRLLVSVLAEVQDRPQSLLTGHLSRLRIIETFCVSEPSVARNKSRFFLFLLWKLFTVKYLLLCPSSHCSLLLPSHSRSLRTAGASLGAFWRHHTPGTAAFAWNWMQNLKKKKKWVRDQEWF